MSQAVAFAAGCDTGALAAAVVFICARRADRRHRTDRPRHQQQRHARSEAAAVQHRALRKGTY